LAIRVGDVRAFARKNQLRLFRETFPSGRDRVVYGPSLERFSASSTNSNQLLRGFRFAATVLKFQRRGCSIAPAGPCFLAELLDLLRAKRRWDAAFLPGEDKPSLNFRRLRLAYDLWHGNTTEQPRYRLTHLVGGRKPMNHRSGILPRSQVPE